MRRGLFFLLILSLLALTGRAQTPAPEKIPAPGVRFFAVPWLEGGAAWHTGSSNPYFTFRRGMAGRHLGGGLAVEVMPSPNVSIGLGLGVVGLGGRYEATYRVNEFFSGTSTAYALTRDLNLTYLRVPFYGRCTPHLAGPLRAYALAGLEAGLLLSVRSGGSDVDDTGRAYADDYGFADAALLGGAGLEWWVTENTALFAGLRYRHGVVGIQDGRPPRPGGDNPQPANPFDPLRSYSTPPDVTYPLRNRALMLEVGVKFGPVRRPLAPREPTAPRRIGESPLRTL